MALVCPGVARPAHPHFMKLQAVDPGFGTHNVLTMAMSVSGERFQKPPASPGDQDGADRLNAIPASPPPPRRAAATAGALAAFDIVVAQRQRPLHRRRRLLSVSWSYFDAFRVPFSTAALSLCMTTAPRRGRDYQPGHGQTYWPKVTR